MTAEASRPRVFGREVALDVRWSILGLPPVPDRCDGGSCNMKQTLSQDHRVLGRDGCRLSNSASLLEQPFSYVPALATAAASMISVPSDLLRFSSALGTNRQLTMSFHPLLVLQRAPDTDGATDDHADDQNSARALHQAGTVHRLSSLGCTVCENYVDHQDNHQAKPNE